MEVFAVAVVISITFMVYKYNECKHKYVIFEKIPILDDNNIRAASLFMSRCEHCGKISKTRT